MAIKPSTYFACLLLFFHFTSAIVVYATAMPLAAKAAGTFLILLSLLYYLARDVFLMLSTSWSEISIVQSGVTIVFKGGENLFAKIARSTIVNPYAVVLRVRVPGHRGLVSRVIFSDALSAEEFRALCVRLKYP